MTAVTDLFARSNRLRPLLETTAAEAAFPR